jgi:hypothetical protein
MRGHALLSIVATLSVVAPVAATPGEPDRSFGTNGSIFVENVLVGLGEDGTAFSAIDSLPDGRFLIRGTERCSLSCGPTTFIARYSEDGTPDATLRGSPFGVLRVPGGDLGAPTVLGSALRSDGALVVGRAEAAEGSLTVYDPNGVPGPPVAAPFAITPQTVLGDGRVLGRTPSGVVRLTRELNVDATFGAGRPVTVPAGLSGFLPPFISGRSIVVGGDTRTGLALWRTDAAGLSSSLFTVRIPFRGATTRGVRQAFAAGHGRAVVASVVADRATNRASILMVGFDAEGRLDRFFGRDGFVRLPGDDVRTAVDEQRRIVVVALSPATVGGGPLRGIRVIVRRLGPRGAPDPSFRTRVIRLPKGFTGGFGTTIDARGRILVGIGFASEFTKGGALIYRLRGA